MLSHVVQYVVSEYSLILPEADVVHVYHPNSAILCLQIYLVTLRILFLYSTSILELAVTLN